MSADYFDIGRQTGDQWGYYFDIISLFLQP
jgi:hypothetical protein